MLNTARATWTQEPARFRHHCFSMRHELDGVDTNETPGCLLRQARGGGVRDDVADRQFRARSAALALVCSIPTGEKSIPTSAAPIFRESHRPGPPRPQARSTTLLHAACNRAISWSPSNVMKENGSTSAGRFAPMTRRVHSLCAASRKTESSTSGVSGGRSLMQGENIRRRRQSTLRRSTILLSVGATELRLLRSRS